MSLHAPPGYSCPFCLVVTGVENEHTYTLRSDVVLRDATVTAERRPYAETLRAWLAANPIDDEPDQPGSVL